MLKYKKMFSNSTIARVPFGSGQDKVMFCFLIDKSKVILNYYKPKDAVPANMIRSYGCNLNVINLTSIRQRISININKSKILIKFYA